MHLQGALGGARPVVQRDSVPGRRHAHPRGTDPLRHPGAASPEARTAVTPVESQYTSELEHTHGRREAFSMTHRFQALTFPKARSKQAQCSLERLRSSPCKMH